MDTPTTRLQEVLSQTGPILLDFDGPVTQLFINGRNQRLADRLRDALTIAGLAPPDEITSTRDPLAILRWSAANTDPTTAAAVEAACIEGEHQCARESTPTIGAADLLEACQTARRPVVIVSNNDAHPIRAFLEAHALEHMVQSVIGRAPGHPELMKPHPDSLHRALNHLGNPPARCALIGDSVTDIEVAHLAGTRSIGYAKTPQRGRELAAAGADALVDHLGDIATSIAHIRSTPPIDQPGRDCVSEAETRGVPRKS